MLTDKYLKYSPEITLDVFTLVCNKLIESGINPSHGESITAKYSAFSNSEKYLQLSGDRRHFECYELNYVLRETTVQEILGYDPFIKDDFVLPEKWCIKIQSNSNPIEVFKWRGSEWFDSGYMHNNKFHYETIQDGYTEITFDQFKKYVLKESIEEPKEIISEYVECIFGYDRQFTKGKVYKTTSTKSVYQYEVENCDNGLKNAWMKQHFIPSTKEAFDAQNNPKSIEKWSVRTYVVFLQDNLQGNTHKKGQIQKIVECNGSHITYNSGFENYISGKNSVVDKLMWFETESEAKEFAKTLIEPVKEEVQQYLPNGHPNKIKANQEFKVGDYVLMKAKGTGNGLSNSLDTVIIQLLKIDESKNPTGILSPNADFMMCYNGKYYRTNKECIIRHATQEELYQHLISIGQIPIGEPLNSGIEPNKDGVFKYTSVGSSFSGSCNTSITRKTDWTIEVNPKSKMILSIDDEELPMVNIIKTNTIKQLLTI